MAYHIQKNELSELVVERLNPHASESMNIQDCYYSMDSPQVKANMHEIALPNLNIVDVTLETTCPLKVHTQEVNPCVGISFLLKGEQGVGFCEQNRASKNMVVQGGQFGIGYSRSPVTVEFEGNIEHRVFEVLFNPQDFELLAQNYGNIFTPLLDDIQAQRSNWMLSEQALTMSPQMYSIIHQMLHCEFGDDLRHMYLQSKSVELLTVIAHELHQDRPRFSFNQSDKDKLYHARQELIEHMTSPPSLRNLSHIVGLNEFKLKKGFKELFGKSVFAYLLDLKLEKAKELLLQGNLNVGEVSERVGYQNQAHFTKAFKKKYDLSPSQLLKS